MTNKQGRLKLIERYGEGCFMERAGIRKITEDEEEMLKRTIKGFKKLDRTITYHHIHPRSKGGNVSIENGANLASYNHAWLHSQPPEVQNQLNQQLRKFKARLDVVNLQVYQNHIHAPKFKALEFDMSDTIDVKLHTNTPEILAKREKYNRAREKQEFLKRMEEDLYERE